MSSLVETVPAEPASSDTAQPLATLRAELDGLDDALHDTLMRRAKVVARIAALRVKDGTPLRPGREAAILRRLLARHSGGLPRQGLVRIWRELFAATTAMQHPLVVAVCNDRAAALAREQFGALVVLRRYPIPAQALGEVAAGTAAVAVLPVPIEGESLAQAWWTWLLRPGQNGRRVQVVARLPFWAPRPEGAPRGEMLVVSAASPDPSGQDRTLVVLEPPQESDRARLGQALAGAGLQARTVVFCNDPGATRALADVEGFVTEDDPRLAALQLRPVVIGAYAVPVGDAA